MNRYRTRHAEPKLREMARFFKVMLVLGARQVGKSTLISRVFPSYQTVVFDPNQDLYGAREDPDLFLDSFPPPLILDEVQYAPELLAAIKRRVDLRDEPGQYLLTGSQNPAILRAVGESLAGRVGILDLEGMTAAEWADRGDAAVWLSSYLDDPWSLLDHAPTLSSSGAPLVDTLWRGTLPGLLDAPDGMVDDYFRSYVKTYLERDVRRLENIRDLSAFGRFLGLVAALSSQELNASQLGRDVGIAPSTARRWTDLLLHTFQWLELPPYHGNAVKRLSGKRKGYLRDTGLACHLQRISSPAALAVSPLRGPLFETWAVNELHRQGLAVGTPPRLWHWRTAAGAEVDLVLERDGKLYPIEVKCKSHLGGHDTRGLKAFRATYPSASIMPALILYAGSRCYRVDGDTMAIPWSSPPGQRG